MRTSHFTLLRSFALSIVLIISFVLYAIPSHSQHYFVYQYFKVSPAQENEFLNLELNVWKKIHQARINANLMDGWYFYRLISPSGTRTEYNFVLVMEYETAEKLAGHFESYGVNYTDFLSSSEIALALKTLEIREMVYEEVWTELNVMMNENADEIFRFQVFNAMKLHPDVTPEEYQRMENKYWKPMHEQRIKDNAMYGWGIYNMIIPGGTERAYQWATVDYYGKFIDILGNNEDGFAKIHGAEKAEKYLEETLSSRDLLKTEVRELLDYYTKSSKK